MYIPGGDIESCVVSLTRALSCSERLLQEIHNTQRYIMYNTQTQRHTHAQRGARNES